MILTPAIIWRIFQGKDGYPFRDISTVREDFQAVNEAVRFPQDTVAVMFYFPRFDEGTVQGPLEFVKFPTRST